MSFGLRTFGAGDLARPLWSGGIHVDTGLVLISALRIGASRSVLATRDPERSEMVMRELHKTGGVCLGTREWPSE